METLVWLANGVRVFHVVLIVALGVGAVLGAFGILRLPRSLVLIFWPSLFVTMIWSALPVFCPITSLEFWLRRQVNPEAPSPDVLPQAVSQWLLGVTPPSQFFLGVFLLVIALGAFGLWNTFGKSRPSPK